MAAAEEDDTPYFHPSLTRESLDRWLDENPGREDVKDIPCWSLRVKGGWTWWHGCLTCTA